MTEDLSATQTMRRDQSARDERVLAQRVEHFIRTWRPTDKYRSREFEQEVHELVYSTIRMAQEPLVKQMSAAMQLVPSPFLIQK